jgi:hypothetical protein
LIADDNALDLPEWVDARTSLIGAPVRLKAIAQKRRRGEVLREAERSYLSHLRRKSRRHSFDSHVLPIWELYISGSIV